MSDDTPTQRFPEAGPAATEELVEERTRSRTLLYLLIGVGAALVIAIVVLLVMLFSANATPSQAGPTETSTPSPTPSVTESTTPTPTVTPTPDPEPEPTPTAAPPQQPPSAIVTYTVSTKTVDCSSGNPVTLTFNWNTTGESVSFGVGTDFADSQPFESGLPAVGGKTIDYQCGQPGNQQKYAIAVFHNGDVIARQTMIVKEN